MSDTSNAPLISLNPSSLLVFTLERDVQSKAILQITNVSSSKVVFKVKTTQPSWYYVRPNQQILDIGQTEDVIIQLVESESNKFLDDIANNPEERVEKHRFLVQSKVIDDEQFIRLRQLESSLRVEEMAKLWDSGDKDLRRNNKLKVEFKYNLAGVRSTNSNDNQMNSEQGRSSNGPTRNNRDNLDRTMDTLTRAASTRSAIGDNANNSMNSNNDDNTDIMNSLQNLRKKYDSLVEYTVHLTAERDMLFTQIEDLKHELTKERGKKKDGSNGSSGELSMLSNQETARVVEKGFSLFVVLISAALAFFLGKYLA